jgi:MFS family permease
MKAGMRNLPILVTAQALMVTAGVMTMALAAIIGSSLAPDKGLATLPIAMMVIGTAVASLPAAFLMRTYGRRAGFLCGAVLGLLGSALCVLALREFSFALFVAGHVLLGMYQGFANYYRFAAVETATPATANRAISWVIAAGLVGAFAGPQLGEWGRDWFSQALFSGSYMAQAALTVVALVLLSRLDMKPVAAASAEGARSVRELLAQPVLQVAILGAAIGYIVMIMVMTATPLAMLGCGLTVSNVTPVIQWHVFAMFAPSFFTGTLVTRYGAPRVMQLGFILLACHVLVSMTGNSFAHFVSGLVLLGVGWNFAFVGGTALLTQAYRPAEQLKVQALNEFTVFGLVAIATLSAGWLYDRFGWETLNLAVLPLLLVALIAALRFERSAAANT